MTLDDVCIASIPRPRYGIARIRTGQFVVGEGKHLERGVCIGHRPGTERETGRRPPAPARIRPYSRASEECRTVSSNRTFGFVFTVAFGVIALFPLTGTAAAPVGACRDGARAGRDTDQAGMADAVQPSLVPFRRVPAPCRQPGSHGSDPPSCHVFHVGQTMPTFGSSIDTEEAWMKRCAVTLEKRERGELASVTRKDLHRSRKVVDALIPLDCDEDEFNERGRRSGLRRSGGDSV